VTTATDRVERALARIEQREEQVRAWRQVGADQARARAEELDAGENAGPLHGVPVGVKDVIDTADLPTENGSPIHAGRRPDTDAAVVTRLRETGAVLLGKTVTTEFAYYHPGPTRNPRALDHTPGGSSSGSAAAVADGMVPLALGTQTAGSTIRPASFCGVAGLATSVGSFTFGGICPLSPSMDTVGLFAASVTDLAAFHEALAGPAGEVEVPEPAELTLLRCDVGQLAELASRAGLTQQDRLGQEMADAFDGFCRRLTENGVRMVELGLVEECAELVADHATIMAREAYRVHAELMKTDRGRLSAELLALLDRGRDVPDEEYQAAMSRVAGHQSGFAERLGEAGPNAAILLPAALGPAPLGHRSTGDPVLSRPWQVMGLPSVALPGLATADGLPLGMQLVGSASEDRALLSAALAVETVLPPPSAS
jgi:Asp-tRNA(Asn)/Glu-tRNA(Gln) amidotransferase A subunit family amidase